MHFFRINGLAKYAIFSFVAEAVIVVVVVGSVKHKKISV